MDELAARNWQKMWSSRTAETSSPDDDALLRLAGYDSPFCRCTAFEYADYVAELAQLMGIRNGAGILDVGCGPGLFYRHARVPLSLYCGVDYSAPLLRVAKTVCPDAAFVNLEALTIDAIRHEFDHIVASSVFQYFPSYGYALAVISKSFDALRQGGSMAILDLNDTDRIALYHSTRAGLFGDREEYARRYAGFSHMFYSKERLAEDCGKLGFRQIRTRDQHLRGYANSAYRFNLFLQK